MKTTIHINKPCNADWSTMDGDARRRMYTLRDKHVHDLSAVSEAQAEKLVQKASRRLCVSSRADAVGRIVHRPVRTSPVACSELPERVNSSFGQLVFVEPLGKVWRAAPAPPVVEDRSASEPTPADSVPAGFLQRLNSWLRGGD